MKKIISIIMVLVLLLCFSSCAFVAREVEIADYSLINSVYNDLLVEKCNEVSAEYGEEELDFHPTYTTVDIDGDGVSEIIIKTGVKEKEYKYEIYAYDPYEKAVVLLGEHEGSYSSLHRNTDDGICIIKCHKNIESKYNVKYDGEKLTFETVYENKKVEHYSADNDSVLVSATANDNALLDSLIEE